MSELLVQMLTSTIATLKKKLVDKDEEIYHLKSKYKTCEAEQADQEGLGSDLVLSLQATIRSLEAKITALRQAEAAARQVVSGYRELWTSTKLVMDRRVKHVTRTTSLENRWDETGIKAMVYQLDLLEARYSPTKSARTTPSSRGPQQAEQVDQERSGQEELLPGLQLQGGLQRPEPGQFVSVPSSRPMVDWGSIRFKPALPSPEKFPVHGVSQDPCMYTLTTCRVTNTTHSKWTSMIPFGTLPGYMTSQGVVAVPSQPVQGYLYSVELDKWVIAARSSWARGRRT